MPTDTPRRDGLELPTMIYVETKVPEAPVDGNSYVRKDAGWVIGSGGGGGGGGSGFMGNWNSTTDYPAGAIVNHGWASWGTVAPVASGGDPPGGAATIPVGVDLIENAPAIVMAPGTGNATSPTFSNSSLTRHTDEAGEPGYRTAWWTYRPAGNGLVTFDTNPSAGDTVLHLFRCNDPTAPVSWADLTKLAVNDDYSGTRSRIDWSVTANTIYYIRISSYFDTDIFNYGLHIANSPATVGAPTSGAWTRLLSATDYTLLQTRYGGVIDMSSPPKVMKPITWIAPHDCTLNNVRAQWNRPSDRTVEFKVEFYVEGTKIVTLTTPTDVGIWNGSGVFYMGKALNGLFVAKGQQLNSSVTYLSVIGASSPFCDDIICQWDLAMSPYVPTVT